nr:hypothetical protein [Tanacetum cinerariifolium]
MLPRKNAIYLKTKRNSSEDKTQDLLKTKPKILRTSRERKKYCLDLLDDVGQIKAEPCDEPMIPKLKLKSEDGRLLYNPEKYRRVVGKLNYLTITRPDIAFPVIIVRLGILYANHGHHIAEGFTYDGYPNTSRSTTGYCVFVGGNLVS